MRVFLVLLVLGVSASGIFGDFQDEYREPLQHQLELLKRLKCTPQLQKVPVKELLPPYSELLDQKLLTNVVAIRRCDESCAYCGGKIGYEFRKCLPVQVKSKTFAVIYFDDSGRRRYTHFKADEHLRCRCQYKQEKQE